MIHIIWILSVFHRIPKFLFYFIIIINKTYFTTFTCTNTLPLSYVIDCNYHIHKGTILSTITLRLTNTRVSIVALLILQSRPWLLFCRELFYSSTKWMQFCNFCSHFHNLLVFVVKTSWIHSFVSSHNYIISISTYLRSSSWILLEWKLHYFA